MLMNSREYHEMLEAARQESSENARPEMAERVNHIVDHDIVFLGCPIWNGDMPMTVYNFVEAGPFRLHGYLFTRSMPKLQSPGPSGFLPAARPSWQAGGRAK